MPCNAVMCQIGLQAICRKHDNLSVVGNQSYLIGQTLIISEIIVILDMDMESNFFDHDKK